MRAVIPFTLLYYSCGCSILNTPPPDSNNEQNKGVEPDADERSLKITYRKLALKYRKYTQHSNSVSPISPSFSLLNTCFNIVRPGQMEERQRPGHDPGGVDGALQEHSECIRLFDEPVRRRL